MRRKVLARGAGEAGVVHGSGAWLRGEIMGSNAMTQAEETGRKL